MAIRNPDQFPPHRPGAAEKLFFLFSGALISTPFPALANSLATYYLVLNYPLSTAANISIALVAPILEEFAKAYPLFYRHIETQRSIVTLGFLTGLGFGIAEFLLYIFLMEAPISIRLPLLFFHATNTAIVGFGIAKNRALVFYLIAVILHAFNNFSARIDYEYGTLIAVAASFLLAWILYRQTTEQTLGSNAKF